MIMGEVAKKPENFLCLNDKLRLVSGTKSGCLSLDSGNLLVGVKTHKKPATKKNTRYYLLYHKFN